MVWYRIKIIYKVLVNVLSLFIIKNFKKMTLEEIKTAVDSDQIVYWKSENFQVVKNLDGNYFIKHTKTLDSIPLTWSNGTLLNGNAEEFYANILVVYDWYNFDSTRATYEYSDNLLLNLIKECTKQGLKVQIDSKDNVTYLCYDKTFRAR